MNLIKKLFHTEKSPQPSVQEFPSILEQTDFKVGFFNFGLMEQKGTDYFNCGLVQRPDGIWLIARRSRQRKGVRFGMNDIMAFLLDGKRPVKGYQVRLQKRWPDEQWEDARAYYHDGKTYISCCDFVWSNQGWTGAHQIVERVSSDWFGQKRFDPIYGHNGENLGRNSYHEKNWIWFFHNGEPHLVYQSNPHVVARFNWNFELMDEWQNTELDLGWDYGEIRGGTPPVLVGDEYWTFYHSSVEWKPPYRRYVMGAYAFESKPPFRITRNTLFPILTGSDKDPHGDRKPIVVFACGAIIQNGVWFVTFGVNDLKCGWMEIPHDKLLEMTFPVDEMHKKNDKDTNVAVQKRITSKA